MLVTARILHGPVQSFRATASLSQRFSARLGFACVERLELLTERLSSGPLAQRPGVCPGNSSSALSPQSQPQGPTDLVDLNLPERHRHHLGPLMGQVASPTSAAPPLVDAPGWSHHWRKGGPMLLAELTVVLIVL
jgi:hypothetical protein